MRFDVLNEKQLNAPMLLADGEYDFKVLSAEDTVSQRSGKEMIKLTLALYEDGECVRSKIFDYLIASFPKKINHFMRHTGLKDRYESGMISAYECDGKTGRCAVKTRDQDGYPPQNYIDDYLESSDIPF